jgi:hypothetical protein
MSQYTDSGVKAFTAGAAIAQHLRVKISSEKLAAAGITDRDIGTLAEASFADLDVVPVNLANKQGTVKMVAAAAITMGALVYTAASGKVSVSAQTAYPIGIAMEAALADGDVIEVMRFGVAGVVVP